MSTTFSDIGHAEKILLKLWKQCENEELCDAVLIAGTEDKRIPAHRAVLSAASEYFDEIFASSKLRSVSREVETLNVDGDILQQLVEYCYTGCVVISEETVVELFKTAQKLLLSNVVRACENMFLEEHIHPSNCFGLVLLAERYHFERLLKRAKDNCLQHLLKMYGTDEFLDLTVEQLRQLLGSDDLCVPNEEDVFNSLVRWIEYDRIERVKHLAELLKLVRLPLLKRSFLIEHVKPICTTFECLQIYMEAIEWHLLPDSTIQSISKLTKPRNSSQVLMAISLSKSNKMFIHYYCSQRNEWMKWLQDLEYRRCFGVAVMENYLFIVGGRDSNNTILNTVIRLSLRTMALEQMTPLNEHRDGCCATVLNGILYVVGGWNSRKALNSVEKWNSETNKWDAVAYLSTSRCFFGIAVLNDKLYAVGGYSNGNALNSAEYYDPILNVWQFIESMVESRQYHGVAVANGMLYAVGGFGSDTVERYDPETNQWTMMCSLREEIFPSPRCTSLCDKVVVCYKDRIEEFDAAANEWKEIMSLKQRDNIYSIFSYSDKLLTSEFVNN